MNFYGASLLRDVPDHIDLEQVALLIESQLYLCYR